MRTLAANLALAVFLLPAFSGCLNQDVSVKSTLEGVYDFEQYHWGPARAFDATGQNLTQVSGVESLDALPRGRQQVVNDTFSLTPAVVIAKSGALMTSSWDRVFRSTDHGQTWKTVYEFLTPGFPTTEDRLWSSESTLWLDTTNNRLFALFYNGGCDWLLYSDDEGEKWSSAQTSYPASCADHHNTLGLSTMARIITAKDGPKALPIPHSYPNVFYWCESVLPPTVLAVKCSTSYDGGATFAHESVVAAPDHQCFAPIAGIPAAYPDGTIALPLGPRPVLQGIRFMGVDLGRDCGMPPAMAITEDNGLTWQVRMAPIKASQTELVPSVTVTPDGVGYMVYRGADQFAYVIRSTDKFQTWQGPWRVSPGVQTLNKLVGITSGDNGRIAISFLGTSYPQVPQARPSNASQQSHWHLYVTSSFDAAEAAPTFVTHEVSPMEDPLETGPQGLPANLGFFLAMTRDAEGRFYTVFMDGCDPRNGCATDTAGAYVASDRILSVAVQDSGMSLFESAGVLPSLGLRHHDPLPHEQEAGRPTATASGG